ncbi:FTR1 family protein [Pseudomonas sp. F1_0610]|uniref:FTR1 family iron permease n=1 Tax=Pseudomonas sp. F1_0610 TaxID=3114284 RepID=UPI0039C4225E
MGQVLFVVWREAVEALLVIGILYAWLTTLPEGKTGKRFLLLGVVIGLVLAAFLAASIYGLSSILEGETYDLFMIGMQLFAAVLIVQMVYWMSQHGRHLKQHLEQGLSTHVANANWLGVTLITAIAIAREGSEIVVFLSSTIFALTSETLWPFIGQCALGLVLAFLTFYCFQATKRFMSWQLFFKITTIVLLFLGASLFLKGMEGVLDYGESNLDWELAEWLLDPVWNISDWLNDSSSTGSLLASLFAYRSQPTWYSLICFGAYWLVIWFLFKVVKRK